MLQKKNSKEVLRECGINARPVPLEAILRHYNIQQVELPASGDIFGALVRRNDRTVIAVNPNQHPNRQRFTIAHELGHFFRHPAEVMEYVDTDFRVIWRNTASSAGVDWKEIEANRFAANLLMPEDMLRQDLDHYGVVDRSTMQHLASIYKVSRLAMQFRLINLGILPPEVDPSEESN
jgi:Zn-dependent peptidase ImmA (M78 family)